MQMKVIDWSYYRGTVPGYGDCRAVPGEYACLLPDRHVVSFLGIAPLPGGENINYLRIPRNPGDGRMAGGGQTTDRALEWQWPAGWVSVGTMFGPNGVIYGAGDVLTPIVSRAQYQATAGWRYVTSAGALVDCESTYADVARGIYEWTAWPDVAIGQGVDGIAVVSFPGEPLRRLDPRPISERGAPADMRFMRSDRRGDLFGIAIPELKGRQTYFVWPTLAELRALPFVTDAPPIEPPTKPPVETPVPTDYLGIVQRVRAKYPTPLGARHWEFLVDVAQQTGTQLFRKEDDNSAKIPALGKRVSLDIIGRGTLGNRWADILAHSEGTADPVFQLQDTPADGEYVDVSGVALPGAPAPPPAGPTHRYMGGGNDTGTCDQCGQARVSDVHRVPDGRVPHTAWLGEDGTGDCDLCFQPADALIHDLTGPGIPPERPPSGDLEARVRELETWRAAVGRVT